MEGQKNSYQEELLKWHEQEVHEFDKALTTLSDGKAELKNNPEFIHHNS